MKKRQSAAPPARVRERKAPVAEPLEAGAITAAAAYGVDIDQLRQSLARTPDERLRELDANMTFLVDLQKATPAERTRRRP